MPYEIERKFLIKKDTDLDTLGSGIKITQGYLCHAKERTVRIRIKGEKAFLTIKGSSNQSGTTRFEFEKEISLAEAKDLLAICPPSIIEKTRIKVPQGKHTFEIDRFHGENDGLILAEIELNAENEAFERPHWLGEEVTGQTKYYNSALSQHPYQKW